MNRLQGLLDRFRTPNGKKKVSVGKDPSFEFLLVAKHFVEARSPIGYDDIMEGYESFPLLKGYLHALKSTGVIAASADDKRKYVLTQAGFEWAKETLGPLRLKPEVWAKADAHFSKLERDGKPSETEKTGKPDRPSRPSTSRDGDRTDRASAGPELAIVRKLRPKSSDPS